MRNARSTPFDSSIKLSHKAEVILSLTNDLTVRSSSARFKTSLNPLTSSSGQYTSALLPQQS